MASLAADDTNSFTSIGPTTTTSSWSAFGLKTNVAARESHRSLANGAWSGALIPRRQPPAKRDRLPMVGADQRIETAANRGRRIEPANVGSIGDHFRTGGKGRLVRPLWRRCLVLTCARRPRPSRTVSRVVRSDPLFVLESAIEPAQPPAVEIGRRLAGTDFAGRDVVARASRADDELCGDFLAASRLPPSHSAGTTNQKQPAT